MFVTCTPNPTADKTLYLPGPLQVGWFHRATEVTVEPTGKGINVAKALARGGQETTAVFPCNPADSFLAGLELGEVTAGIVPIAGMIRTNVAVVDPSGTTTKLNEPGPQLSLEESAALAAAVLDLPTAAGYSLSGSLPPGLATEWYRDLAGELLAAGAKTVVVDTSEGPLFALREQLPAGVILKPNSEELAQLATGRNDESTAALAEHFEQAALAGDWSPAAQVCDDLVAAGAGAVLVTLGPGGAMLATGDGTWVAPVPATKVVSTVAAGDSALAGFLMGRAAGAPPTGQLARAVAWGSATAALPGSEIADPARLSLAGIQVAKL